MKMPQLFVRTILLTLFALSVCARLPFIDNLLIDEEGAGAYMAVDNGDGGRITARNSFLGGRVDGRDQLGLPQHPVIPYYALVNGIRPFNSPANFNALSVAEKSRLGRRPYFLMFLTGLALVFYVARWVINGSNRRALTICLLVFGGSVPLLVGGSIQPQLDGSWGAMICAGAAALLIAAASAGGRKAQLFSATAGFLAAIGKTEWALALLAAALAAAAVQFFVRREQWEVSVAVVAGILAGSVLSYLLDPTNFLRGFELMHRFATAPADWNAVLAMRWPWIRPVVGLAVAACVVAIISWRQLLSQPLILTVFLWGLALFGGFFLTAWSGDGFPRYFCPAAILLLFFLIESFRTVQIPRFVEIVFIGLLLAGSVRNVRTLRDSYRRGISITSLPGISMKEVMARYSKDYELFVAKREAVITDAAYGYYFPDASFAAQSMGIEEARKALVRWSAAGQ
jgi:hypothetical protein